MSGFQFPENTVHLAGTPKASGAKHMDVWFLPEIDGEEVLVITQFESGRIETFWSGDDSVEFHRSFGLEDSDMPPSERIIEVASRRFS